MTHACDDTAYPAAAMPDECTCGGPMYTDADGHPIRPFRSAAYNERNTPMTDPTAAETLPAYMASRAETIGKLYAADEDCDYTLDGRDTDDNYGADPGGTPWYRCSTHNDTAMGYVSDGEPRPPDFPCNGWRSDEDGYSLGEDGARERLDELPLSVEIIRHVKILFGTGGPADWLDAELDADGDIRVLEYHYADWHDHAQVYVEKDSPLWRYAESVAELMAETA